MVVLVVLVPLLVAVVVLLVVLSVLSSLRYGEWRRQGVPYLAPWPLVGNCFRSILQKENIYQSIDRVCRSFPGAPFVGMYAGPSPVLLVQDVEAIKNITVKDFHIFTNHKLAPDVSIDPTFGNFVFCLKDNEWKTTRVKLSPAFTSGRLKSMHPIVRAITDQLVESIRNHAKTQDGVAPIASLATMFGVDVIGSCALGIEAGALKDPQGSPYMKAVAEAFRYGAAEGLTTFLLMFVPAVYKLVRVPLLKEWRMTLMRNLLREAAKHREKETPRNRDIFDVLLSVQRSGELTPERLEVQVMALQVAGSETSAKTIMFALWELARAQRVQDKLRAEIKAALAQEESGELSYETVHSLPYLDMTFKETLRLWPLLPWLDRVCSQDYTLPGTDLFLKQGSLILIPAYSIQRDPTIFKDPDTFSPDRFSELGAHGDGCDKTAWMPFGLGPRACIGSRFADMTVKTAISEILLNFRVSLAENSPKTHSELPISPTSFLITLTKELTLKFQPI